MIRSATSAYPKLTAPNAIPRIMSKSLQSTSGSASYAETSFTAASTAQIQPTAPPAMLPTSSTGPSAEWQTVSTGPALQPTSPALSASTDITF